MKTLYNGRKHKKNAKLKRNIIITLVSLFLLNTIFSRFNLDKFFEYSLIELSILAILVVLFMIIASFPKNNRSDESKSASYDNSFDFSNSTTQPEVQADNYELENELYIRRNIREQCVKASKTDITNVNPSRKTLDWLLDDGPASLLTPTYKDSSFLSKLDKTLDNSVYDTLFEDKIAKQAELNAYINENINTYTKTNTSTKTNTNTNTNTKAIINPKPTTNSFMNSSTNNNNTSDSNTVKNAISSNFSSNDNAIRNNSSISPSLTSAIAPTSTSNFVKKSNAASSPTVKFQPSLPYRSPFDPIKTNSISNPLDLLYKSDIVNNANSTSIQNNEKTQEVENVQDTSISNSNPMLTIVEDSKEDIDTASSFDFVIDLNSNSNQDNNSPNISNKNVFEGTDFVFDLNKISNELPEILPTRKLDDDITKIAALVESAVTKEAFPSSLAKIISDNRIISATTPISVPTEVISSVKLATQDIESISALDNAPVQVSQLVSNSESLESNISNVIEFPVMNTITSENPPMDDFISFSDYQNSNSQYYNELIARDSRLSFPLKPYISEPELLIEPELLVEPELLAEPEITAELEVTSETTIYPEIESVAFSENLTEPSAESKSEPKVMNSADDETNATQEYEAPTDTITVTATDTASDIDTNIDTDVASDTAVNTAADSEYAPPKTTYNAIEENPEIIDYSSESHYSDESHYSNDSDDSHESSFNATHEDSTADDFDYYAHLASSSDLDTSYTKPSLDLLSRTTEELIEDTNISKADSDAEKLVDTLKSFGIGVTVTNYSIGPAVTRYELQPDRGVKVSRIVSLADDIALNLAASSVRIEAPIPGKAAVGIEIPNSEVSTVLLRDIVESEAFINSPSKLSFALGRDTSGNTIIWDIAKMPHLLIAGATGSGKSVCINSLIASIIFKALPSEVKLILIDPKVVELSIYNGIPHLLTPVLTDPKKAAGALNWAIIEMNDRYKLFAENGVRDLVNYNNLVKELGVGHTLPQIVIIIDELADLMMISPKEVEDYICRLAQMARAAGMHLVIATQRPSVDVITGVIKANIPSRISFAVSSQVDSRTILDMGGAEKLMGNGDMLFNPLGMQKPIRVQGCYISDREVDKIVSNLKSKSSASYNPDLALTIENSTEPPVIENFADDDLLKEAVEVVLECGQASASLIQRKLRVGYARAARILDQMQSYGIISLADGSKARRVLISKQEWHDLNS